MIADHRLLAISLLGLAGLAAPFGCSGGDGASLPGSVGDASGSGTSGASGGIGRHQRLELRGAAAPAPRAGRAAPGSSGAGGSSAGAVQRLQLRRRAAAASSAGIERLGSDGVDGGALWSPTTAAPIHFHWMIGGFTTADILPNQAGTVVYDIDGENSTAADVAAIHAAGAIAVCYVDVGTLEKGRSDYSQFPSSVVGPGRGRVAGRELAPRDRGQPERHLAAHEGALRELVPGQGLRRHRAGQPRRVDQHLEHLPGGQPRLRPGDRAARSRAAAVDRAEEPRHQT